VLPLVDLTAVTERHDDDQQYVVLSGVDDPVVADSDS
jgi:hypothetical protein